MPDSFDELKRLWHLEILGEETRFSWRKLLRRAHRSNSAHYLFWFRLSQFLYKRESRTLTSLAKSINKRLTRQHSVEIMLGAEIEEGLSLGHPLGIVVYRGTRIGKNCKIRQNTTIGSIDYNNKPIYIGDNVDIGANSCIIGSGLRIGSNVRIGAMSFVKDDIPDNCTYVTTKTNRIILRESNSERTKHELRTDLEEKAFT